MPDKPPLVRPNTLKEFLKSLTELRVSEEALTLLSDRLTEVTGQIAKGASKIAIGATRQTILGEDIEKAFDSFLKEAGASLFSADEIRRAIDGIPNDAMKELITLLKKELEVNR